MRRNLNSSTSKSNMNHSKMRHVFLALADLLLTLPTPVCSQSSCLHLRVPIREVVYEQPVSINTDVLFNTTFYPFPEAAITVMNAPTSYSGVTTLQWTSTVTTDYMNTPSPHFLHSTAPSPSPTQAQDSFVLVAMRPQQNQKRQSGSYYVNSDGTITNDCTSSPIYTAKNGVLTATVKGVVYTYSTSAGVGFAPFVPSTVPGSITTSFTIGANAVLQWQNPAFFNGQANFCALQNGTVYAVFAENAQPQGCLFISLSLFQVSSCQAISLATITGPPGPIGSTGSPGSQGVQGVQGQPGVTGPSGLQGLQGSVGATGATGIAGQIGPSGPAGIQGLQGLQGSVGATGASGVAGQSGPSGATGIPGPSALPGNIFGYIGCYAQTGASSSTTGKALSSFQNTYTTLGNKQCSDVCRLGNFNYFGTVNFGSASVDCYCGNAIAYVTSNNGLLGTGSVTGPAGENNCYPCVGGATAGGVSGACGNSTVTTIAIYARGF